MGLIDRERRPVSAAALTSGGDRPRPPRRFVLELEDEIRQLYVRMIDDPIPPRLIDVLRAGLASNKP